MKRKTLKWAVLGCLTPILFLLLGIICVLMGSLNGGLLGGTFQKNNYLGLSFISLIFGLLIWIILRLE